MLKYVQITLTVPEGFEEIARLGAKNAVNGSFQDTETEKAKTLYTTANKQTIEEAAAEVVSKISVNDITPIK